MERAGVGRSVSLRVIEGGRGRGGDGWRACVLVEAHFGEEGGGCRRVEVVMVVLAKGMPPCRLTQLFQER